MADQLSAVDLDALEKRIDAAAGIQMLSPKPCHYCGKPASASVRNLLDEFRPVCPEHDWTGMSSSIMIRRSELRALIQRMRLLERVLASAENFSGCELDELSPAYSGWEEDRAVLRAALDALRLTEDATAPKAGSSQ